MSEIRNPPPNVWWHCYACGQSNGPRDTEFCSLCGRRKEHVIDRERWEKFFTLDATIAEDVKAPT